jgi:hypothetical protein
VERVQSRQLIQVQETAEPGETPAAPRRDGADLARRAEQ